MSKNARMQEKSSRRQKIVKKLYHRNPEYFTNDLALMTALEAEGYFKICEYSKGDSHELLEFDLSQVKKYLETHHEDLFNTYAFHLTYVQQQDTRKQQQLLKVLLTVCKFSYDRYAYRMGMAARPRHEFQKAAFGKAVNIKVQNAVLDEMCLQGLGSLDRGRSHEKAAKINEERAEKGEGAVRSKLSIFTFTWTDVVAPEDLDVIAYLVRLKLVPASLLEFSHLPAFKQFAVVMDHLAPGMEAFEKYCDSAGIASKAHRAEVSKEIYAAKVEGRAPEKIKRDHKIGAAAVLGQVATKAQKVMLADGTAEIVDNKFVVKEIEVEEIEVEEIELSFENVLDISEAPTAAVSASSDWEAAFAAMEAEELAEFGPTVALQPAQIDSEPLSSIFDTEITLPEFDAPSTFSKGFNNMISTEPLRKFTVMTKRSTPSGIAAGIVF